ncbi:MAG: hypothetical protein ACOCXJ_00520 [Planctomycetota bacterium]
MRPDIRLGLMAGLGALLVAMVLLLGLIGSRTDLPEGYSRRLTFEHEGREFYTTDLPDGALLYRGQGRITTLPDVAHGIPESGRITPIPLAGAPAAWRDTRPAPPDEWQHFHSAYDAQGAVRTGIWLRHEAQASFTYDMGGRVGPTSVLHHEVEPGLDTGFASLIEFDRGPATD